MRPGAAPSLRTGAATRRGTHGRKTAGGAAGAPSSHVTLAVQLHTPPGNLPHRTDKHQRRARHLQLPAGASHCQTVPVCVWLCAFGCLPWRTGECGPCEHASRESGSGREGCCSTSTTLHCARTAAAPPPSRGGSRPRARAPPRRSRRSAPSRAKDPPKELCPSFSLLLKPRPPCHARRERSKRQARPTSKSSSRSRRRSPRRSLSCGSP